MMMMLVLEVSGTKRSGFVMSGDSTSLLRHCAYRIQLVIGSVYAWNFLRLVSTPSPSTEPFSLGSSLPINFS